MYNIMISIYFIQTILSYKDYFSYQIRTYVGAKGGYNCPRFNTEKTEIFKGLPKLSSYSTSDFINFSGATVPYGTVSYFLYHFLFRHHHFTRFY